MRVFVLLIAALAPAFAAGAASAGQAPASTADAARTRQAPASQAVPAVQAPAAGQIQDLPATICNNEVPAPAQLPPSGSPPVVTAVLLCFEKQGGYSVIELQTYVYYIQLHGSRPSMNEWIRYD